MLQRYPGTTAARDRWILERRGPKAALDPEQPYAFLWEEEPDASGTLTPTAVVFLTNRECPFRCVMCDLWVNTLDRTVEAGAIASQIRHALDKLPSARQIKLYNAGSFFDPRAIPPSDDGQIANLLSDFETVIVESHPAFLSGAHGDRCLRFRDLLAGRLEVAVGLETVHEGVLARLNKAMTVESFGSAATFLANHGVSLRVFILLNPPFLPTHDAVEWACRSIDFANECEASACSVIPTRSGNGAMEAIGDNGELAKLPALEAVVEYGLSSRRSRVFADLWEVEHFFDCSCSPRRAERLRHMNRAQQSAPRVECACDARR